LGGSHWSTSTQSIIITNFDDGADGKVIYINEGSKTTYDCTGNANFICGSVNLVVGTGGATIWKNDNGVWRLESVSFPSIDLNLSSYLLLVDGLVGIGCTTPPCLDGTANSGTNWAVLDTTDGNVATFAIQDLTDDFEIRFMGKTPRSPDTFLKVPTINNAANQHWWGKQYFRVPTYADEVWATYLLGRTASIVKIGDTSGTSGQTTQSVRISAQLGIEWAGNADVTQGFLDDYMMIRQRAGGPEAEDSFGHIWFDTDGTIKGSVNALDLQVSNQSSHTIPVGAKDFLADGTLCSDPAKADIPSVSGSPMWSVTCDDNDGSTIYGSSSMPDSWGGATNNLFQMAFRLKVFHPTDEIITCDFDATCQCVTPTLAIDDTYTTETKQTTISITTVDLANQYASAATTCVDIYDNATGGCGEAECSGESNGFCDETGVGWVTKPVICVGSCTGEGQMVRWKLEVDAADSHANCAQMELLYLDMEYFNGGIDD
jgi:hypothetical protein